MKIKFTILALFVALTFVSCSKDDIDPREDFIGRYLMDEECDGSSDVYTLEIEASDSDDEKVKISNLFGLGDVIFGSIDGSDIRFRDQNISGSLANGTITEFADEITIKFTVDNLSCTATGEKL